MLGAVLVAWACASCAAAFQIYPGLVPNGAIVDCPAFFSSERAGTECQEGKCIALGHVNCLGGKYKRPDGSHLNPFGKAFIGAGAQWTVELCQQDSDGDGVTNGQELGDPCCVWNEGDPSPVDLATYPLSHPGFPEDAANTTFPTEEECTALRGVAGPAVGLDLDKQAESLYQPGEEHVVWNLNVTEHTLLPNETVYSKVFYPIPKDKPYYMVGAIAHIDNVVRTHHFVLYLCTEEMDAYTDVPKGQVDNPANETTNGYIPPTCLEIQALWAPGADVFRLPPSTHMPLGKGHQAKTLLLEVHYNNVDGVTNETDASAYNIYLTTKPRQHKARFYQTGSVLETGTIPAGGRTWSSTQCVVDLTSQCSSATVIGHGPHTHFLGTNVFSELYRPADLAGSAKLVGDLTRASDFSYENQRMRWLKQPVAVHGGDIITTTCLYSSNRAYDTPGGLASNEEMCIDFLLVWPAECLSFVSCVGSSSAGPLAADIDGRSDSVHSTDFVPVGSLPDFAALVEADVLQCNRESAFSGPKYSGNGELWQQMGSVCSEFLVQNPEDIVDKQCSSGCKEFVKNLWTCLHSGDIAQDEILGVEFPIPATWLSPPPCMLAISEELETELAQRSAAFAQTLNQWGLLSACAALAFVLL